MATEPFTLELLKTGIMNLTFFLSFCILKAYAGKCEHVLAINNQLSQRPSRELVMKNLPLLRLSSCIRNAIRMAQHSNFAFWGYIKQCKGGAFPIAFGSEKSGTWACKSCKSDLLILAPTEGASGLFIGFLQLHQLGIFVLFQNKKWAQRSHWE